jgi:branched-subunit amino acid aminotransferase/4-amino-4-deoxychorismate lyase
MVTFDGKPPTTGDLLPLALTSYGHFTSMRVGADGRIRGLSLHLERLQRDSRAVFGSPVDLGRVRELVRQELNDQGVQGVPCVVRVTHCDPAVNLGRPADIGTPRLLVTVRPGGELALPPMTTKSVTYERDLPRIKHCGLFGALHARRTAQQQGFDDALFTGTDGLVTEGGTWNAGFVDHDGTIVWPQGPVLPGVTMALLQERADSKTAPVTLDQATRMRAAFATNTAIGVRALSAIDHTPLATDDPVLDLLRATYLAIPGEEL